MKSTKCRACGQLRGVAHECPAAPPPPAVPLGPPFSCLTWPFRGDNGIDTEDYNAAVHVARGCCVAAEPCEVDQTLPPVRMYRCRVCRGWHFPRRPLGGAA